MAEFFKPADGVKRSRNGKRERLAVGGTAVPLTVSTYVVPAPNPVGPNKVIMGEIKPVYAMVQVLTAAINFTVDGTTPTNALGYLAAVGDIIHLPTFQDIQNFKAIQNVGAGAIEVTYFYGR